MYIEVKSSQTQSSVLELVEYIHIEIYTFIQRA